MAKPGPSKGQGGRPRKAESQVAVRSDGYKRVTVGAKSKGTQVYAHRAKAGLGAEKGSKAKGKVVHHKDRNRSNNSRKNLKVTTKAENNKR